MAGPTDGGGVALQERVESKLTADGWETDSERVAAGTYRIAGLDEETSTRRFILAVPSTSATVTESQIEWMAQRAQDIDADIVELTTNGSIAGDAHRLAAEHDIDVRDPESFQRPPSDTPQTGQSPGGHAPPSQQPQQQPSQQPQQPPSQQAQPQGQQPRQQQTQQPHQPPAQQPPAHQQAPPVQSANSGRNWSMTRLATLGGGVLGGVGLMMPWVVSIQGNTSWNGLSTELTPFAVAGLAVALLLPALSWGKGWGRLSALLSGAAGVGMVALSVFLQNTLSSRNPIGYIEVDGNRAPLTLVEAGGGLEMFMLAGALVALGSLAGLIASFS